MRFEGHTLTARSAAVVVMEEDAQLPEPWAHRAESLGGRSFLIPVGPGEDALSLSQDLAAQPGVASALPDLLLPRVSTSVSFDDPVYDSQWYLERLDAELLFERSLGDPALKVAVIDSAIEIHHADLEGAWTAPYDAFGDDEDPSPNDGEYCYGTATGICDSHGTSVSGIIAARANNGTDMVGLCAECTLIPIKLLGEGSGALSRDIAAFEHAIAQDAAVINNSWGYTESIPVPETLALVIERAATETRGGLGSLVVFAAGNDDREIQDDELQALPTVLSVSATDSYGFPTNYTNVGNSVDIAAPSATVTIAAGGGTTSNFGGTSAAAPVISGIAAWVLAEHPELSADEVHELLISTARPSDKVTHDPETGHHPTYGYGIVDIEALLLALDPQDTGDTGLGEGSGCAGCSGRAGSVSWVWLLGLGALATLRRRRE